MRLASPAPQNPLLVKPCVFDPEDIVMAATIERIEEPTGLVGDDEVIEAFVQAQAGPPAWVSAFGLIGQVYLLATQRSRVVIATNRQVRIFEASIFATKLPIKELASGARGEVRASVRPGKVGRSELDVLGESLWVTEGCDNGARAITLPSPQPLAMPEPEGQQARRDQVLAANRDVVNKRRLMAVTVVLAVMGVIALLISSALQDDARALSQQANAEFCGGELRQSYIAYTTARTNVLVIGDRPGSYNSFDGAVFRRDESARFEEIVNDSGQLGVDVVVCATTADRDGGLECTATGDNPTLRFTSYLIPSSVQSGSIEVPAPQTDCLVVGDHYRDSLWAVAGRPIDRPAR